MLAAYQNRMIDRLEQADIVGAIAEPHGAGVAFHPTGVSHVGPTTFGYPSYFYGKRDAEPHYGATSFVGRTIFGYPRVGYYGKRSAEPHGTGVAFHPTGVSHVGPTTPALVIDVTSGSAAAPHMLGRCLLLLIGLLHCIYSLTFADGLASLLWNIAIVVAEGC